MCDMLIPYLIEPYNSWNKGQKKKHWMEIAEEESLMRRVIQEQQAVSAQQVQNAATAAPAAGAGGVPPFSYFDNINTINRIIGSFISRSLISDPTQIAAVATLVTNAIDHGWWQQCDLIYPFVGGTSVAHAQNLKSENFTIAWSGSVTHDNNGITGDGASGYGDTGYSQLSGVSLGKFTSHFSLYLRTTGSINVRHFGTNVGASMFMRNNFLNWIAFWIGVRLETSTGRVPKLGLLLATRTRTGQFLYTPDQIASDPSANPSDMNNSSLFILTANDTPLSLFSNANYSSLTVGGEFTSGSYQIMKSDWQAFQTTLGRQV